MFKFQEDLLHYIWKLQYFDLTGLHTTDGQQITITHPGYHNFDAGPDFSSAKVVIGHTEWIGNLEIHIKASDWVKHRHYNDRAYDNVILHVVYEEDEKVLRPDGSVIPCLELKDLIHHEIFEKYFYLKNNNQWIPCEAMINKVDDFKKKLWLEKLLVERLEKKSKLIYELLEYTNNDWEYCLFIIVGKYFGSKVNNAAFEHLCKSLSLDKIFKNIDNTFAIEALIFGQAGLLNKGYKDAYPKDLMLEYEYLKHKYTITPIPEKLWKFFRLRPSNFPTIRIAQFCALLTSRKMNCSKILEISSTKEYHDIFNNQIHDYWTDHYLFDRSSKYCEKRIGNTFLNTVLINAIIPFIFVFGKKHNENIYVERAIKMLQELPPESNKITMKWKDLGLNANCSADSQALIHLKQEYCDKSKCLNCSIGHQVMQEDYPVYNISKIATH